MIEIPSNFINESSSANFQVRNVWNEIFFQLTLYTRDGELVLYYSDSEVSLSQFECHTIDMNILF